MIQIKSRFQHEISVQAYWFIATQPENLRTASFFALNVSREPQKSFFRPYQGFYRKGSDDYFSLMRSYEQNRLEEMAQIEFPVEIIGLNCDWISEKSN